MKFTKAMLALAACGVVFTACKKDEGETHEHNEVTIEITKPAENNVVVCNGTNELEVHIHATEQIHGYEIKLTKVSDGEIVWQKQAHAHGTHLEIVDTITSTVCEQVAGKLEVTAIIDHDGNTKVATRNVMFGEVL